MSKQCLSVSNDNGVLLSGYYKKLKTLKKKFFVLYNDTPGKVARIEYYDSEKKYRSGFTPKRVIKIKNCFNINRRLYTKHDFVIVLASKEGGFGMVMDSEDEMNTWLSHLLHLQRSGESCTDFPKFENCEFCSESTDLPISNTVDQEGVWQAVIQKRGLAEQQNVFGNYHICLSNNAVTFVRIGQENKAAKVEILITTIRRCGHNHGVFYLELGRQSPLGAGELWIETEDILTSENMYQKIYGKMGIINQALAEPMRKRSSSATETTNLRQDKKFSQNFDVANNYLLGAQNVCRDRCDSLPTRNRSSSESNNRILRMAPSTSANRVVNFQVNNTSSIACSASEESVTVDDNEESVGIPYLISSRSPECAIPEEYTNDSSQLRNIKENSDTCSVATSSVCPAIKPNLPLVKQSNVTRGSDLNNDICENFEDQLHFSVRSYAFGSQCENDATKESAVNRVRAFSVGSRMKNTRICAKTSPKLFNSDSVDCSSRKSISVPVLVNKNSQSVDQMGDLMEIDFSKSAEKTFNRNFHYNRNECQNTSYLLPRNITFSNSEESVQKCIKKSDNGYLEMKPITLDTNILTSKELNPITNVSAYSHNQHIFVQKDQKMDSAASNEVINIKETLPKQEDSSYIDIDEKDFCKTENDPESKSITSTSSEKHSDAIKLGQEEDTSIKKDLYYASLDLPKCASEVNNRYGFQESLSDTNIEDIKNEYAKINFLQPDASRGSIKKKNIKF